MSRAHSGARSVLGSSLAHHYAGLGARAADTGGLLGTTGTAGLGGARRVLCSCASTRGLLGTAGTRRLLRATGARGFGLARTARTAGLNRANGARGFVYA